MSTTDTSATNQTVPPAPLGARKSNKKKELTFEDWPKEVINMPCKEFHRYIKEHQLTDEQQSDLRRVRRREQGRIAVARHRNRVKTAAKLTNDHAEDRTYVSDVINNALSVAKKQAFDDIALAQYVITRLQEQVERMQTAHETATAMLQLSGTVTDSTDASGRM